MAGLVRKLVITLLSRSIYKGACYFHANSNHCLKQFEFSGIVLSNFLLLGLLFVFRLKRLTKAIDHVNHVKTTISKVTP